GLGLSILLAGQLAAPLLARITATDAAGRAAVLYFRIRILGAPLLLVVVALREARYGTGDSRSPMVATVTANLVNIMVAASLIHVKGLGVAGVAWATVVAHAVEAGFLVVSQQRIGWRLRGVRASHAWETCRLGFPTGIQFFLEIGSFGLLTAMLSSMGEKDAAAHQVALQVIHFSFLPSFAVGEAVSILSGQAVGAGRDRQVLRVARLGMWLVGAYTGACTIVLTLGAPWIVSGFTSDPGLSRIAVSLLYVAAVFQIFDGANIVARGALRGTGDVRFPALLGVLTAWCMTPPLTWLLGLKLHWGAVGGWLGLCAEIVIGALLLWWRLERRHWLGVAEKARARMAEGRIVSAEVTVG
ncbi:MAG: MATE family efflux transporter, partial [Deltaproteobacteria bacterium]|nr:MATE family efflux transporter [Deltaproteobacteria bacterium]